MIYLTSIPGRPFLSFRKWHCFKEHVTEMWFLEVKRYVVFVLGTSLYHTEFPQSNRKGQEVFVLRALVTQLLCKQIVQLRLWLWTPWLATCFWHYVKLISISGACNFQLRWNSLTRINWQSSFHRRNQTVMIVHVCNFHFPKRRQIIDAAIILNNKNKK